VRRHEIVHQAACQAAQGWIVADLIRGTPDWKQKMRLVEVAREEIAGYSQELNYIAAELKRLQKQCEFVIEGTVLDEAKEPRDPGHDPAGHMTIHATFKVKVSVLGSVLQGSGIATMTVSSYDAHPGHQQHYCRANDTQTIPIHVVGEVHGARYTLKMLSLGGALKFCLPHGHSPAVGVGIMNRQDIELTAQDVWPTSRRFTLSNEIYKKHSQNWEVKIARSEDG
jgi:hypothetical protein